MASTVDQVPVARRAARRVLASWGVGGDLAYTAALIVTELVANVAEHAADASPAATVLLAADDWWLTVSVHDASPRLPRALTVPYGDGGRGLRMVMLLAEDAGGRHTVEPTLEGGKHIVVHLPLGKHTVVARRCG
ncbi:ATP-binding protein [Sphaerisporangium rufum]|uniref:ATP-binding protein n=1 Tax=Sphaerisporangium rufum TaxID=1381558 RepID=UPI00194F902D|nr:ATP-binding protein [Sphaerisporangium rufum]